MYLHYKFYKLAILETFLTEIKEDNIIKNQLVHILWSSAMTETHKKKNHMKILLLIFITRLRHNWTR